MASRGVLRFLRREEEEEHGFNPSHSWSVKPIITITTMAIILVAIENLDGRPVFVRCWVVTLKYLFMLRQRNVW